MNVLSNLSHQLINRYYRKRYLAFKQDMPAFKDFQLKQLRKLLTQSEQTGWGKVKKVSAEWSYKKFSESLDPSTYEDYHRDVENQMVSKNPVLCLECHRYQPTSGSTSGRKWIPYSKELTTEFDMAIGPWIGDLYETYPAIIRGKHYWSLSWMPDELREKLSDLDDLNVFGWWQQMIMRLTMASPNSISHAKTAAAAQLATLAYLCSSRDLTMLFVWSPTFALNLLDDLYKYRHELIRILEKGKWGDHQQLLERVECPKSKSSAKILRHWDGELSPDFLQNLWPNMGLVSSWDTASSKAWAEKLKGYFPNASFQGKGLFATEAVVTIPFQSEYVLAYKSHFYEFECLETGKILPSWELEKNQMVAPLVSTGSGFFRYKMKDRLEVTNFMNGLPCLTFRGRMNDVDLVGEKMSPELVEKLFDTMEKQFEAIKGVSLLGVEDVDQKPFYLCIVEGEGQTVRDDLEAFLEKELKKNFHYNLARDLGQLDHSKVSHQKDGFGFYQELAMKKGMIKGDVKLEILSKIQLKQLEGVVL